MPELRQEEFEEMLFHLWLQVERAEQCLVLCQLLRDQL